MSYWARILTHYESKKYFTNGLTIPFLLGARKIVEPKEQLLTIEDFMEQINSFHIPVTLLNCSHIGEYVISLIDEETNKLHNNHLSLFKEIDNLICTDDSLDKIDNKEELTIHLKTKYYNVIASQTFSRNEGKWTKFTITDKERLNEILTNKI